MTALGPADTAPEEPLCSDAADASPTTAPTAPVSVAPTCPHAPGACETCAAGGSLPADAAPLPTTPEGGAPPTATTAPALPVPRPAEPEPPAPSEAAGPAPAAAVAAEAALTVPVTVPGDPAGAESPVSAPSDAPDEAGEAPAADAAPIITTDDRPSGAEPPVSAPSDAPDAPGAARPAGGAAEGDAPLASGGTPAPAPRLRVTRVAVERPAVVGTEPTGDGPRVEAVVVGTASGPVARPFVRAVPLPRGERAGEEPVAAPPPVTVTPVRLPLPEPTQRPEEPQP
ncbi:hypothetical protein ACFY7C_31305 [Streptomyces sp. NPDC012769]|uniref:hypothetical protein n=1 Tax=Streptomyces sp. NPDC012769 TaxID=3364848 RepID=UPI0036C90898